MEVEKMDENDWKYHGEGNKSIVVSHAQHSQVLRFLKHNVEDHKHRCQTSEQAQQHIQNIVDFGKHVMRPLLGENYVHHGEAVKLPLDFVRLLSLKVEPERPESRTDKVMDTLSGWAMCLPNLTQLPDHLSEHRPPLCIEIKPKCGFLPWSRHVTKDVKLKACRFCMHQHLKISSGKWKRRSQYCPLDLFSGSKQRMFLAIKHLLEEAQNNLKIFKNGELIFGCKDDVDQKQDLNELAQHLWPYFSPTVPLIQGRPHRKAVLHNLTQVVTMALLSSGEPGDTTEHRRFHPPKSRDHCRTNMLLQDCCHKANRGLPKDCVLSKILQVQLLDDLDIEGIYPLYKRVERYLAEYPEERSRLQLDGPYNESFLERVRRCPSDDDGSIEYAVGKIHQYRVAMAAKDCSIMITLAPYEGDDILWPTLEIQPSKPRFRGAVSILDLDPKPYESIPHQYKLDLQIVSNYLRSVQSNVELASPNLCLNSEDCTLLFHSA
ncbi:inositol-pentakisphosphate 2-kinase-like [Scleropages formosus]|uniref:Inositol-pentakisphosphate 2-kinase n=1 Tax=Scleropages formosus TaxID=113540 RepID=A0A8C9RPP0_SCLFO|nr:inositol-pentakisphosphate 2-kinase-like [Scleropages formosus]